MLDPKLFSENFDEVKKGLERRGGNFDLAPVQHLLVQKKTLQLEFDSLRARQNQASKEIPQLKKSGQDVSSLMAEMQKVAERIKAINPEIQNIEEKISHHLLSIPNIPHSSVPLGKEAGDNKEVRSWGKKPDFSFKPKEHWEIGENLGILDFERGVKIAGARFTLYRGWGARLERAIIQFMLDTHINEHGYEEVLTPFMVNRDSMTATGQLPKFEEDLFSVSDGYFLVPTAEVPVTNIFRDEILKEEQLPIKFCSYTPCFRREAGTYGKDTKGLIRQHQFNKVELVQFAHPEKSYEVLESLTANAEKILQKLGLHYRTMVLCTGDMGFGSAKTYDIEVWLPGQNTYREISSCSNFEDFQARRGKIRFKDKTGNKLVHTLNGSGLAVGRTLVAILENYQQADGSIVIPEALRPYLGGLEKISKS